MCIRVWIYTIAKIKWEHKNITPYKYGCVSNATMYITSLINITFKHNEHEKSKHAKCQSMRACKQNGG